MDISGTECARARESVSADLDRELYELESRRLRAHLRVCPDCAAWAASVTATTGLLREARLEVPAATTFDRPGRSRTRRVGAAVAAGPAAVLVVSILVSLAGAQRGSLNGQATSSTHGSPVHRPGVHTGPVVDIHGRTGRHAIFLAI